MILIVVKTNQEARNDFVLNLQSSFILPDKYRSTVILHIHEVNLLYLQSFY